MPAELHQSPPARRRGRPRDEHAEDAILAAAEALLLERGVDQVTMSAVVERSGVSRATAYRRWPNREALLGAVLRRAIGQTPFEPKGNAVEAFHDGIEYMRNALTRPAVRNVFPELVRAVLRDQSVEDAVTLNALLPGMARLVDAYRRLAAKSGLREDVDAELVGDLLFGVMIATWLRTGRPLEPPSDAALMDILLNGLRPREATSN